MADLLSTIKSNGGLYATSNQQLDRTATQAGLQAPATSPLAAASLGASTDASKMAGTPANQANAVKLSLRDTLANASRTKQITPGSVSSANQDALDKGAAAAQFQIGTLQSRVQQKVDQALAASMTTTTSEMTLDESRLSGQGYTEDQKTRLRPLLSKLGTGQASSQDVVEINQAMGVTDPSAMKDAASLKNLFLNETEQVSTDIAKALTADKFSVADLGFTDDEVQALSKVSGKSIDELSAMSVADLGSQLEAAGFTTETQKLRLKTLNPAAGAAEKAEAREQLRAAGASGLRAADAAVMDLADAFKAGDSVTFDGRSLSVESLLSSEFISDLVTNALTDPESMQHLEETEPDFAAWIKANKSNLQAVTAGGFNGAINDALKIQREAKSLTELPHGITLSDDTMKLVDPQWGSLHTSVPFLPPALQAAKDSDNPDFTQGVATLVNGLAQSSPEEAKTILSLGSDELMALGITSSTAASDFLAMRRNIETATKIDPTNSNALWNTVLPGGLTQAQDLVSNAYLAERTGLGTISTANAALVDVLDANRDGKVDDAASVQEKLKAYAPKLTDLLTGGRTVQDVAKANPLSSESQVLRLSYASGDKVPDPKGLLDALKPAASDGVVDGRDVQELLPALQKTTISNVMPSVDLIKQLRFVANSPLASEDARQMVSTQAWSLAGKAAQEIVAANFSGMDPARLSSMPKDANAINELKVFVEQAPRLLANQDPEIQKNLQDIISRAQNYLAAATPEAATAASAGGTEPDAAAKTADWFAKVDLAKGAGTSLQRIFGPDNAVSELGGQVANAGKQLGGALTKKLKRPF